MIPVRDFHSLETFSEFSRVVDPAAFTAVDDADLIGLTDVVGSTGAIAEGRYKAVNMVGAAAISAMMNALEGRTFPFAFGGDGASFLVAAEDETRAREALAATRRWSEEAVKLQLRAALVPVSAVRAAGHDVTVARFAASEYVSFAMFSGGGLAWAEREMKDGRYAVAMASPGTSPNLTGLSCRWTPITARHGLILSLIARPQSVAAASDFASSVQQLLTLVAVSSERAGHPVSPAGPDFRWPPVGLDLEAKASQGPKSVTARWRALWLQTLVALVLFRTSWKLGGFDPVHYRRTVSRNTDFRKFDDGLRMTLDCSDATADKIEALLREAQARGILRYGTHRQAAALMTCIVPSILSDSHVHFLDGAGGGYAAAAMSLK